MAIFDGLRLPLPVKICGHPKEANCRSSASSPVQNQHLTLASAPLPRSERTQRPIRTRAAAEARPCARLLFYPQGNASAPVEVEYRRLYDQALETSRLVRSIPGFRRRQPVLLHLHDHWDVILWFWAVLLAGGVPVPSSPFSNVPEHRRKHVQGLSDLLESPVCITRDKYLELFDGPHTIQLQTIESLLETPQCPSGRHSCHDQRDDRYDDLAALMLTSGSTGNAKAVKLTHRQILAAVSGKASVRRLPRGRPFLNWVGLDHVASLVEIHIQALRLQVDQVHVHASDIVSSPLTFLDLLSRHRVARSFAPNFFLAKLVSAAADQDARPGHSRWDLSGLAVLASGGEANEVDTCVEASQLFHKYGAPLNVITPGFGMTETCAGAIYNLDCPGYDTRHNLSFASVGTCMKGIEMRITIPTLDARVLLAPANEPGDLEVRGAVVFRGYYRNNKATAEAFTQDGWFRTGDRGLIDSRGSLQLIGRAKEMMNINGVKISSADIQNAIEKAVGAVVTRVVTFPSRSAKSRTEQVTVAYVPQAWPIETGHIVDVDDKIVQACVMCTGSRPFVFPLKDEALLPKTTLGKISKAKMKTLFEGGVFAQSIHEHDTAVQEHRQKSLDVPASESEALLIADFVDILNLDQDAIGVETPIFEMGFTSLDLIRLKRQIDRRLQVNLPVVTIMTNPTARSLAVALRELVGEQSPHQAASPEEPSIPYDPVVTFRSEGSKTPLWLIHPGVGEVLVFVGLAQHLATDDRPVYALRARGFEPGQTHFSSISEVVETYLAAIRRKQPEGPYAIAGYSYGTMLAFEIAKKLEGEGGQEVGFLGSFNLPPHIKTRMRQLNWNRCLLHLSFFLDLVPEAYADSLEDFPNLSRDEAKAMVLSVANKQRMAELGLNEVGLANWADLAYGLQSMASDYEPEGSVGALDVFHAIPLTAAARSREDWLQNHLGRWKEFSRTEPRFHAVGGAHYTMIGPEHVVSFAATLKAALRERGV
ncbi:acyl-protein synthetase [Stachybotrys elegans]|uniref:Acyl-protein synthetase n=1 Tax=Stachybotrys elegans TaxID=80388 RepID=A0A8K0WUP3_9HYPO|nr:acyl-protein synthetase [Stachybotrys elegans]